MASTNSSNHHLIPLGPGSRYSDPPTSHLSADETPGRIALRRQVLDVHRAHPEGLTDDELSGLLPGLWPPSVARRRTDLAQLGYVSDSGARRLTRRGRWAIVWTVVRVAFCGCPEPELADRVCETCNRPNAFAMVAFEGAA
jgi:hypothetical protein